MMLIRVKSNHLSGRERARKAVIIANIVQQPKPDLEALRQIAIQEGGFLSSQIRSRVWPALLTLPVDSRSNKKRSGSISREQAHRDNRQVELDVRRSLSHFGLSSQERKRLLPRLTTVIDSVLARHPDLYYYQVNFILLSPVWHQNRNFLQGFNDVCSIVVYVMRDIDPFPICERLALYFFREVRTLPPNLPCFPAL